MKPTTLHLCLAGVWLALLAPTLLWWRESIVWLALMSWYANLGSHISSWQAAHAEECLKKRGEGRHAAGPE